MLAWVSGTFKDVDMASANGRLLFPEMIFMGAVGPLRAGRLHDHGHPNRGWTGPNPYGRGYISGGAQCKRHRKLTDQSMHDATSVTKQSAANMIT